MSKRNRTTYYCTACGNEQSAWSGKCLSCGEWNSIKEYTEKEVYDIKLSGKELTTSSVKEVATKDIKQRITSGDHQLDDVLGGGFVQGSIILLAGQPGIGKSTLLLQVSDSVSSSEKPVLYVSGEESEHQIAMRASRIGKLSASLQIVSSTSTDDIAKTILGGKYQLVIIDSIQTLNCENINSAAGSMSQITNSTSLLTKAAKATDTTLIIVGHVTKEGSIAGPKLLEHSVDVVLQLEGDRYGGFKLLRSVKNRYGSTNETAIYEMINTGIQQVKNPSAALLEQRRVIDGSIVMATMEGSRPLLVEIQALVNTSAYGYPKRAASGFDINRLNLLIAMLERRTKLKLADKDVYINIVGGIDIDEPAADLAICMAIASASKGMCLKKDAVVFGEIGLSGEIRHVNHVEKRISEAKKMGFNAAIGPRTDNYSSANKKSDNFLLQVDDIRSALNQYLEKG